MSIRRELEICAETLQACSTAAEGGANRIELCAALSEGGVTPSLGFLREVVAAVPLPIHVLIRPRISDFCYSAAEFRMMCADADSALAAGGAGIVIGILTPDHVIDQPKMAQIARLAQGRSVTFHRAFDQTPNLLQSLQVLLELGYSRVLTSGGRPTVMEGREMLAKLTQLAAGRIRIAAGGGVTLNNAAQLTTIQGLDIHASLRPKAPLASGDPLWNAPAIEISVDAVRALSGIVDRADLLW